MAKGTIAASPTGGQDYAGTKVSQICGHILREMQGRCVGENWHMKIYNLKELLEMAYSDGFTSANLSKATGVSKELIDRYYNHADVDKTQVRELGHCINFLMELYRENIAQDTYIRGIVQTLNDYFEIPNETIANYLHMNIEEFNIFLENPCKTEKHCSNSLKIQHLFLLFVRDKKYCC